MAVADSSYSPVALTSITSRPGCGSLAFRRARGRTVVGAAFAVSPLRLLTPRNHGDAAWVYSTTFGGGLVDGDCIDLAVDLAPGTFAFLGSQASTKVYRSAGGCSYTVDVKVAEGACAAIVPDPVVCFAGARYTQRLRVATEPGASVVVFDAYTCGRAARGERWDFARLDSRTSIFRAGARAIVDATLLDGAHGSIRERMGGFDVVATLVAAGPRLAALRDQMLRTRPGSAGGAIAAASPVGDDAVVLRVVADRFASASRILRPSFLALAGALGDDPFARKW
jgi:urease accessory protein